MYFVHSYLSSHLSRRKTFTSGRSNFGLVHLSAIRCNPQHTMVGMAFGLSFVQPGWIGTIYMEREIASAGRTDSLHLQNFTRKDGIFSSSSVSHNCRRRCRPRDRPTGGGDDDAAATTADEPCDIPRYGAHVGWTLRGTNLVASAANSNSVGHLGLDRNSIPTRCNSAGRRLPFRSLHRLQHVTVFSHASLPPRHRGST